MKTIRHITNLTGLKKAREYFEAHPEDQDNGKPHPDEIGF
ncbi:hypothetical protein SAMN04488524_3312 [Pedobacter africanus]|uniref:Uncharacterized protein n=1 Tax=Pedobacter africanus TaxID=151894 RepID=A0A1W2CVS8_9SPHI|nr:hypothetical protein SAMN04488524_3312 [Pedobacter africanus]